MFNFYLESWVTGHESHAILAIDEFYSAPLSNLQTAGNVFE